MQTKLGNYISTQKGYAFKSNWYQTEGMPIVKVSDFTEDSIDISSLTYIPEEIAKDYTRYQLTTGDVVIQTVGSWANNPNSVVGKAIKTPLEANGALLNQNAVRLDPNEDLDKAFMFYLLRNSHFKDYIVGCAQGAASQASITLEAIRDFSFDLPPISTQRRIANILSAYDDLIYNNNRRIRILEGMAQTIYQEWFGKVDKESLPKGWSMTTLGEACNIVMGQSPASEFYNEEGKGLPFHQGVTNFGDRFPTDKIFCTAENRIAESGDILFSVRAPVGRLNISTKKIIIGRGLCAIRSKTGNQSFVFQQLKEQFHEDDMMGGGTIFKSVTKDDMFGIKFLLPPKDIIEKFETFANPISRELEILTAKNANLRQTRDLLLPRLVSGEIAV